ncbi:transcriptional adapter 2-alpha-like [Lineus longissimus]|uniref:transcriptional adapter 2-alpha-like n=1 Tax=Lineus longissimus TaxID=88925 RepID=UPI002B4EACE3
MDADDDSSKCKCCLSPLDEPYISCAVCQRTLLCVHCFARGYEEGNHKNFHAFEVVKNNFPLFAGSSWTASEEKKLVDAIADCGIGNWQDVSNQLQTRSRKECEEHYYRFYFDNPQPLLPVLPMPEINYPPPPVIFKLSEDPPRPADGSVSQLDYSGYMAARGDFQVEYDNYAEMDLKDVHFDVDDSETEQELKLAVVNIYWNVLKERHRRKRIIRKYGLINVRKVASLQKHYERTLQHRVSALAPLTRLLKPQEFDMYLEGLSYEQELQADISRLQEFHMVGITKLSLGRIYYKLKKNRENVKIRHRCLDDVLTSVQDGSACKQWLQQQAAIQGMKGLPHSIPPLPRKTAPPLDIANLPGYDKLGEREKEVCSNIRLVPEAYMDFKRILVVECNKVGSLRLAQARNLIKIDVNKTRKLFDFLVDEGVIVKEQAIGK